ncbi:hypothetical protein F5882DRAFT_385186 [Hyaloscypha sp. PMI_1271]|nr:hypothetical protein F5882DRAFT_385186 [Hyaloscypha sp. PMI_1271]
MGGRLGLLAPSQAGYGAWGACRKAAASAERLLVRWSQEARATGQGANAKAAEEGVRFGQTIWLSWVLAVPCHQACSGALNFARHEGRLGGGYPDVSAAVPRYGGSLDVQLLAQVYRIQVPSCIFFGTGTGGLRGWLLGASSAACKKKNALCCLCSRRLALWLCFLDVLWSLGWWRWAFVLVSRHFFHSIVILQLGRALLDVFVTLASPFLRLYQSALNSVIPAESIRGTGQGHSRFLVSSPRRMSVQDFKGACRELSLFSVVS